MVKVFLFSFKRARLGRAHFIFFFILLRGMEEKRKGMEGASGPELRFLNLSLDSERKTY